MITPSFSPTATERVLPKLALDFTTANLDPRVTFTRTTDATHPATYVNSSGYVTAATNNQPRFDYDPVALTCKGLLIEESRTNSLTYSNDFANGAWTPGAASIASVSAISPDGSSTSQKLVEDTNNAGHTLSRTVGAPSVNGWESFYMKSAGRTRALVYDVVAAKGIGFDLSNGTAFAVAGITAIAAGSYTITDAGNGWYRTAIASPASSNIRIYMMSGSSFSYQGDGSSGILLYGAQLEAGAFVTSYIPTTSSTLTRNADSAYIDGTNFTSFWNTAGMGFSAIYDFASISNARYVLYSASNARWAYSNAGAAAVVAYDGTNATTYGNASTANTVYKISGTSSSTGTAGAINGGVPGTAASNGNLTTVPTQIFIGSNSALFLNGHVYKVMFYNLKITTNEVQAFSKQ